MARKQVSNPTVLDFLTDEDAALLQRDFEVSGRGVIEGLLERIPDTSETPLPEYSYSTRPEGGRRGGAKPDLRCAIGHPQRHWRGEVLRYNDGSRIMVGRDCAEKHFGLKMRKRFDEFDDAKSRKRQLQLLIQAHEQLVGVIAELRAAYSHESVRIFDSCRREFVGRMPKLVACLKGIHAHNAGSLVASHQVRDYAAEDRAAGASKEGRDLHKAIESAGAKGAGVLQAARHRLKKWRASLPHLYKQENVTVGHLQGAKFLTLPRQMKQELERLASRLFVVDRRLQQANSSELDGEAIDAVLTSVRAALIEAWHAQEFIAALDSFSSPQNLEAIARWAALDASTTKPRFGCVIKQQGRRIIDTETSNEFRFPDSVGRLRLPKTDALRNALNAKS